MAIDRQEAKRRGQSVTKKSSSHPIAAIEKRVMDSQAHACLSYSARAVLMALCRNKEKDRNGHIQLSEKQAESLGIERKALRRALKQLISHQLIVMTWRGGKVQGSCNKYALTWEPIKDSTGIQCHNFKRDAWRDWKPEDKKSAPPKCPQDKPLNVPLTAISNPKMSLTPGVKRGHIEVIPVGIFRTSSGMVYRSIQPMTQHRFKPSFGRHPRAPLRC